MKTVKLIGVALVVVASNSLFGCASAYKVRNVETELDVKGSFQNTVIGLNKDQEVVAQQKELADAVARKLVWEISDLKQEVTYLHGDIESMAVDMADPRLGGNKKPAQIPELDNIAYAIKNQEEMGLDEAGTLVVVKKEMFKDKLESLRKEKAGWTEALKLVQSKHSEVLAQYGYARVEHNLPAKRILASGYYTGSGSFKATQRAESNLDDAFRLSASTQVSE